MSYCGVDGCEHIVKFAGRDHDTAFDGDSQVQHVGWMSSRFEEAQGVLRRLPGLKIQTWGTTLILRGTILLECQGCERDEEHECDELSEFEGHFRLRRRQRMQSRDLLKRLDNQDKEIEVERQD